VLSWAHTPTRPSKSAQSVRKRFAEARAEWLPRRLSRAPTRRGHCPESSSVRSIPSPAQSSASTRWSCARGTRRGARRAHGNRQHSDGARRGHASENREGARPGVAQPSVSANPALHVHDSRNEVTLPVRWPRVSGTAPRNHRARDDVRGVGDAQPSPKPPDRMAKQRPSGLCLLDDGDKRRWLWHTRSSIHRTCQRDNDSASGTEKMMSLNPIERRRCDTSPQGLEALRLVRSVHSGSDRMLVRAESAV
jgi:hypothetical protein